MFEKIILHAQTPERAAASEGNFYQPKNNPIGPGMNQRIEKLRKLSVEEGEAFDLSDGGVSRYLT